jgi:ribosome recycling factor
MPKRICYLAHWASYSQLLDGVSLEAYGTRMALHEVASISAPDTQLLIVKPWDKNLLQVLKRVFSWLSSILTLY